MPVILHNDIYIAGDAMVSKIIRHPIVKAAAVIFILIFLVQIISALTFDRIIEYKEIVYTSEKLSAEMDGYTIAFITDVHGSTDQTLEEIAEKINGRSVDLLLFGGDFQPKRLDDCLDILETIDATDGVYGVEGNHDDAQQLSDAMSSRGMTLLENSGVSIRGGFYLAGSEDLWNRSPDIEKALEGAGEDDFVLMLSHNPDTTMLDGFGGVDLTLSGHTHGGEVTLLNMWGPALVLVSNYGQRFRSGWAESAADTDVYVSNGIGRHFLFRMMCRPQVIYLTLRSQPG